MYSISETIARTLMPRTDHVFDLLGNGNAWFVDALERLGRGIITVRPTVETVAAADTYHRVTRRPAVATTTYGAGFTNTMTTLADGSLSRIPLLLVVGTAPSAGPRCFDIDRQGLARAVGVETFTVHADDVAAVTLQAWNNTPENTHVILEIPYDLAAATATGPTVTTYLLRPGFQKLPMSPTLS